MQTLNVSDGNTDVDSIRKAIDEAKACTDKPTMINVTTLIGYGSPNKVCPDPCAMALPCSGRLHRAHITCLPGAPSQR